MKKIFLLAAVIVFMSTGCNENKQDEKATPEPAKDSLTATAKTERKSLNWASYTATSPEEVQAMADHYASLVSKDPSLGVQQINMDGELLALLLLDSKGLKLIPAADLKTNAITVFLQFWRKDSFSYYEITDFFNSGEPGMRGQQPVCPPPAGCDLPLKPTVKPNIMTEGDASAMSEYYNQLVVRDPSKVIRQVTMDAFLLEIILYGTQGLKLIAAADLKTNETTIVMQFWKAGTFYYYDIRDIFTPDMKGMRGQPPVCPPPAGCDLPFGPAPKMNK